MKRAEESPVATLQGRQPATVCGQLRMVSAPVYISVMLFAVSTWIAIVGIWVEMPLLVHALPESWNLPSYLVIIIQCANLGPATYTIWDKLQRRNRETQQELRIQSEQDSRRPHCDAEVGMTLIIILIAATAMLLLSLFWNQTTTISSVHRSVALLTLVSFAALSCCTSSVVFLPYMAHFPSIYISAYYFGQGLCGLIPGILGLSQSAGQETQCRNKTGINNTGMMNLFDIQPSYTVYYSPPRFSVSAFFVLIAILLCISAVAFCCLNFVFLRRTAVMEMGLLERRENPDSDTTQHDNVVIQPVPCMSQQQRFLSLFVTIGIVSSLWNGILPATQTYTCLPYGNAVYRWSVCLSWVVSPLATLPNMFAPTSSVLLIVGLGTVAVVLSAFHIVLAVQSPHPVMQGSITGQVVVVSLFPHFVCHCSIS